MYQMWNFLRTLSFKLMSHIIFLFSLIVLFGKLCLISAHFLSIQAANLLKLKKEEKKPKSDPSIN